MQGLGNGFGNRWMPLLITSALFGAMHLLNPEIKAFGLGLMMTYYITFGLFLGIISLMDNSLDLALGIHAATNIFGAAIVTFDGSAL
ncbi:MAG: CPBP family glutamic-type intramembrane protease, partial [Bacteroidota bacterium]